MNDIVEQYLFPSESNMERKHELSVGGIRSDQINGFSSSVLHKFQVSETGYWLVPKNYQDVFPKKNQDEANLVVRFGLGYDCTNQASNTHIEKEITESPM